MHSDLVNESDFRAGTGPNWITTAQAAAALGRHPVTLRRWRQAGLAKEKEQNLDAWLKYHRDAAGLIWKYKNIRHVVYQRQTVLDLIENSI